MRHRKRGGNAPLFSFARNLSRKRRRRERASGTPTVLAILLACAIFPMLGAAHGGVVGSDPVKDVAGARSQPQAREALRERLPRAGGRLLLVSPHDYLPNVILPLRREGVLREFHVVLPFDNSLGEGHLDEMRSFLEVAGVGPEDRGSFALDNGSIAGRIDGMTVTLQTLTRMPRQKSPSLLAIDTAVFPALYRNEVKTPMAELAWKLVLTLRDRGTTAESVVLFDAVGRPDFPLGQGYVFALLKEMVGDPGRFETSLPEKWRLLRAAEGAFYFSQYGEGVRILKEYLRMAPGDASGHYKMAMVAIRDLDADMALQWLEKASDADPLYRRAYVEAAGYVNAKEQHEMAMRILQGGLAKFPGDPLIATGLAGIYMNRGEAARDAGDPETAIAYFREAEEVEGAAPGLREKARSLSKELAGGGASAPPR